MGILIDNVKSSSPVTKVKPLSNGYPELDLYIMIPCILEQSEINIDEYVISDNYLQSISQISSYEMNEELASSLERCLLSQVSMICLTDNLEQRTELGRQDINIYLTQHIDTGLACVTLFFPSMSVPVTHILDQMSRNELLIAEQENEILLLKWLEEKFGLKSMGMSRSFTNLSHDINELDLMYLLANEVNGSEMISYQLNSDSLKKAAEFNISQFDMSKIYVYDTSVVQVYKNYQARIEDRLYDQALTLFIMELVLMQDAAVSRVNHKVSLELNRQSNISLRVIEEINFEFAKTMFLWNLNQFRYSATQALVNSFIKAFKLKEQLDAYKTNKEFLEQLINVHSARSNDRKTKLLNICVIFLTVSQVLPIYYIFMKRVLYENIEGFDVWFGISTIVLIISIWLVSKMIIKSINRKPLKKTRRSRSKAI